MTSPDEAARRMPLVRETAPREQLTARRVRGRFPAGIILTYAATDVTDEQRTWEMYNA